MLPEATRKSGDLIYVMGPVKHYSGDGAHLHAPVPEFELAQEQLAIAPDRGCHVTVLRDSRGRSDPEGDQQPLSQPTPYFNFILCLRFCQTYG